MNHIGFHLHGAFQYRENFLHSVCFHQARAELACVFESLEVTTVHTPHLLYSLVLSKPVTLEGQVLLYNTYTLNPGRSWQYYPLLNESFCSLEYPWITYRATSDHDGVYSRFFKHLQN